MGMAPERGADLDRSILVDDMGSECPTNPPREAISLSFRSMPAMSAGMPFPSTRPPRLDRPEPFFRRLISTSFEISTCSESFEPSLELSEPAEGRPAVRSKW